MSVPKSGRVSEGAAQLPGSSWFCVISGWNLVRGLSSWKCVLELFRLASFWCSPVGLRACNRWRSGRITTLVTTSWTAAREIEVMLFNDDQWWSELGWWLSLLFCGCLFQWHERGWFTRVGLLGLACTTKLLVCFVVCELLIVDCVASAVACRALNDTAHPSDPSVSTFARGCLFFSNDVASV